MARRINLKRSGVAVDELEKLVAGGDTRTASEKIKHFIVTLERGIATGELPAYNLKTLGGMYKLELDIKAKEVEIAERIFNIDESRRFIKTLIEAVQSFTPKDLWGKVVNQIENSFGVRIVHEVERGHYYDAEEGAGIGKPGDAGTAPPDGNKPVLSWEDCLPERLAGAAASRPQ